MTRLKFNDEGKVYNHLKILRQADPKINKAGNKESRVEVECLLCGTLKNMSWSKVKSGWTKTCGCTFFGARKDITSQRFGKLVAVESLHITKSGSVLWKCVCDCGNETNLTVSNLSSGGFQSCGCMQNQGKPLDLRGQVFARLTALEPVGKNNAGQYIWKCLCECGSEHTVAGTALVEGHTKSCGCYARDVAGLATRKHGQSRTPEYGAWKNAVSRCSNTANKQYDCYGGRGIQVCDRWLNSFERFYEDMGESGGLTLERVNVNGNYEPSNCTWADTYDQAYNTRMFKSNTSGRTGVSETKDGRWQAYIDNKGTRYALGHFKSFESAVAAREAAEIKYHGKTKE